MKTSPFCTKKSKAVNTTAITVKISRNFFLEREKSAMVPRTGETTATITAAMPTARFHSEGPFTWSATTLEKYTE